MARDEVVYTKGLYKYLWPSVCFKLPRDPRPSTIVVVYKIHSAEHVHNKRQTLIIRGTSFESDIMRCDAFIIRRCVVYVLEHIYLLFYMLCIRNIRVNNVTVA